MKKFIFLTLLIFSLVLITFPPVSAEWTSQGTWGGGGFGGKDYGGRYSGFVSPNSSLTAFVYYGGKIVSGTKLDWEWSVTSPLQANLTFKLVKNGEVLLKNGNVTSGIGTEVIEDPDDSYSFLFENNNDFDVYLWVEYSGHSDMPLQESIAVILGLALGIIVPITIILLLYFIFGVKMKKKVEKHFPPAAIPIEEELIKPDQRTSSLLEEGLKWLNKVSKLTGWIFFTIFMGWIFAFYVLPIAATFFFYDQASTMTPPEWLNQWMQFLGIFLGFLFIAGFPLLLILYWFYYYESKHESDILRDKIEKLLGRSYTPISTNNAKKGIVHLFIYLLLILLIAACPTISAQSDSDNIMNQVFLLWVINILIFAFIVFAVYYFLPKRKPALGVKEIPEHVGIAEMLLILTTYLSRRLESMARWSLALIVITCLLWAVMLIPLVVVFWVSPVQIAVLLIFLLIILTGLYLWYKIFKHSDNWRKRLRELEEGINKLTE